MPTDFLNKTFKKRPKTEKVNTTIEFYIFEINSAGSKFQLKMKNFEFLDQIN